MLSDVVANEVESIGAKSRQRSSSGNGRMYDPILGRFLGVDPIIQAADNSQSIDGYGYCLNNPLIYIDQSGYLYNPGFNLRMWQLIVSLWERTPQGERMDFTSDGVGGWQGVRSGSGFQGPDQPYMLGEVTVAAKAPEKNTSDHSGQRGNWFSNIDWSELVNQADDFFTVAAMSDAQLPVGDIVGLAAMGGARLGKIIFGAKALNPGINMTQKGLTHTLNRHTINNIVKWSNKSKFSNAIEIPNLIKQATKQPMIQLANGNYARIVDAGRIIGIDVKTGQATSIYTVITNTSGDLITAFPGMP